MDVFSLTASVRLSAARVFGALVAAFVFAWPLPTAGRLAGVAALLLIAAMTSGAAALVARRPIFNRSPTHLDEAALFLMMALVFGWLADPAALRLLLAGP